ncbi:hypothetical protein O7606_22030 [Micromonospora sp. WMMD882]|uniref:hypothetical protein n=1 Tax=Micromonospora sp. WMMD882 TaxID=3015151 RepID=UPI00248CFB53|nr:hypothetical protein [Micromonospora sp. WMMD882]WBB78853.1 hypothetical protein O7606_22030 [Micromonospora sp. WMMD882]
MSGDVSASGVAGTGGEAGRTGGTGEPTGSSAHGQGATAWTEYLAAARQLDGIRRGSSLAAGEQARSVRAARDELDVVRARLVHQQSRLRELGVPAMSLVPSPPEVSASARSMTAGPAAVLAELRTARQCADTAEGILDARRAFRSAGWTGVRDLLVCGVLALLAPVAQAIVLGLVGVDGAGGVLAALLGLPVAAVALLLGRSTVVGAFRRPTGVDDRRDRSRWLGVLVCGLPAVLTAAGILLFGAAG